MSREQYRMQTAPRNGKLASMIDEAVRHALDEWNRAAEEAARTIVEVYGAARTTRGDMLAGPELRLYANGRLAYRQWWEWKDGTGTLRQEWTDGWETER